MAERRPSRRAVLASGLGAVLAGSGGLALAGCSSGSASGTAASGASGTPASGTGSAPVTTTGDGRPRVKVSVGVIPIIDVAPLYLGVAKGVFARHGLEVTPRPAQGGAAIVPAVLAGEDDFGFSNVVSLLVAREKRLPLVSLVGGVSSTSDPAGDINAVLVPKGSRLATLKDLEGRRVAVNTLHNIADTVIKASMAKAGANPASVKFLEMPFADMPAQLASKSIDAAWVCEPFRTQVLAAGGKVVLQDLTPVFPTLQISQYFTSERTRAAKLDLVSTFVAAMGEALGYASAHPDEVRAVLPTYTKISPDVAAKVVLPKWPAALDRASTAAVGAAARRFGTLRKAPDVAGLVGR